MTPSAGTQRTNSRRGGPQYGTDPRPNPRRPSSTRHSAFAFRSVRSDTPSRAASSTSHADRRARGVPNVHGGHSAGVDSASSA
jgi:hypothetical protein